MISYQLLHYRSFPNFAYNIKQILNVGFMIIAGGMEVNSFKTEAVTI